MGIKGLQWFVTNICPDACRVVDLRQMAEKHHINHPNGPPVIVVDAMCCVKYWYTPESWVCGGQWLEYLVNLENFIKAFMAAGIKLVFYFDGVVEDKKRDKWIERRLQNNKEIATIFQFIKTHRKQPERGNITIPSALPTFTRYALKLLGQKTVCTLQEADFEVAAYGLQHNCMGILGQDSDYLIYDTCPYFSIEKLRLDRLVTVMYSREDLCHSLGLSLTHLPLFACLLGNDVVPENFLEDFWRKCLATSPHRNNSYSRRINTLLAVANYISKVPCSYDSLKHLEEMLPLGSDKTLLYKGVGSYLLPGQQSPWIPPSFTNCQMFCLQEQTDMCQDKEIFQVAKEQHIQSENYAIFSILSSGEIECSNSLEDECDTEIPGQALIYRPARQHIYSILLESGKGGAYPLVKEWFVYFGNPLQQPELIQPVQPFIPGGTPNLKTLWFAKGPDVEKQRYSTFLACFHLQEGMEELQALEAPVAAFCCLLAYLMMQVSSLSVEDLNAFLALVLCLKGKSAAQLECLQLAQVDSRAVHLGAVLIRGLTTLLMANSACGFPFKMDDLMPWKVFDGKLFQKKYQQSHRGCSSEELLEGNESLYTPFQNLRSLICKACMVKKRTIQSRPRGNGFITGTQQRGFNPRFQQTHRNYLVAPYHNQMRGFMWRNSQPQGREYRLGHPDWRRRFQRPPQ
ncbi:constitutive coactivator of peroxisome proliferator-activated receptor gamma isoform X2 [Colius striatus]|uniref:constitutive coactivator of peroxisome proliferator-activated receptor gamma isoform X2 n=1 Tax=Colius striatus TaxID=57412 RepID=UPI002B1D68A6|nr:constitutive coactivator of peroxisome proliferator-activated receptor gamma isoform X2 [Colius striatus]XP_061846895.1 constitutive coactivator of peroxisome proliferator-activated receptor gamma isoform X2 [Colius striatus]XP_061846896.1 constitutive coactivator of peroxisome proliferator-activated receptor gamma isoform X2 [Colius striatus]